MARRRSSSSAATARESRRGRTTASRMVYSFGNGTAEGRGDQRELLGGKGAGLAEMTLIGLPVPAGFTVTTEACAEYYQLGRSWPKGLEKEVREAVARLERASGRRLGDAADPLLVSVRSGAARSMPGMMETILNLGLNDASVEGLARSSRVPRFAWDSYRRFIQMYATVVSGLSKETLEQKLHDLKQRLGLRADTEIPAEQLAQLCAEFKRFYHAQTGREFPQDPWEQLRGAIEAVFGSWMAEKAETYRRVERIAGLRGTAVNVQQMVFGNFGDDSGTGVCFTRDPSTGANEFYGDLLVNAQGEDVVAGIRTPMPLKELATLMPDAWDQLCAVRVLLETHYRDMQDLEFTIERGRLFMLQCRSGKRSPMAAFRIAVEQATRPLIEKDDAARLVRRGHLPRAYATRAGRPILSKAEAVRRIQPEDIERLFYPVIDPRIDAAARLRRRIATGINAVPGAACGQIAFFAADAERMAQEGHKVILVRRETSPEDVGGMHASAGILTATGGKTSHAAVVARGWGKCCIVGCGELRIDPDGRRLEAGGRTFGEGDFLTLDGTEGHVYEGRMELVLPQLPPEYETLMRWADELRSLRVRANADTPYDAANAVRMGAEGIGLCRTEHMFFDTEERRLAMQRMILADTEDERRAALAELIPFQRADFIGIFEAMDGRPVTIRLVDPPLHEFVPHEEPKQRELARVIGVSFEKVRDRVGQLHETNPMLGHRGCRLCVSYPEILQMQVRAIVEAACNCAKRRVRVLPEIMIPLAIDARELGMLVAQARRVADAVLAEHDVRLPYLVGTMVETPRAALLAGALAAVSEFFSFGTNDLTQMTMGLSRDDAGRFLPYYLDREGAAIFESDPFQSIDVPGVGQLVEIACRDGRSANPKLKLGICGEHGGDPASIGFFARAGLDYVSCSPFRVPIARLVAAHLAAAKSPAAKSPAAKSTAAKSASPARASSGDGPLRSKGPAAARKRSKSRTDAEPRAGAKAKAKAGAKAGKGAALQKRSKTALRSAR